jgi:hypothetical protein
MSRAKELAKEYAENVMLCVDHRSDVYDAFIDGYEQAEKDNELSWDDIEKVCLIAREVHQFRGFWSESVYQEVLKRFNKERKEK